MRRLQEYLRHPISKLISTQDRIIAGFDRYAVTATYLAFGFVFFFFGLQKPAQVDSPVRQPVGVFANELSEFLSTLFRSNILIPHDSAMVFIGTYEMFMGVLFFLCLYNRNLLRVLFWLFFIHQAVGFLSLIFGYDSFFLPIRYVSLFGFELRWSIGTYAAFVLKNLVFIGAFMLLVSHELGEGANQGSKTEPANTLPQNETTD